ncbi:MAG: GNAT family N-acetyltransferase [Bdellovibrionales bacterium]|nr:GNAT family N-acetyltransferase [Bdellovibrionales bacterium]
MPDPLHPDPVHSDPVDEELTVKLANLNDPAIMDEVVELNVALQTEGWERHQMSQTPDHVARLRNMLPTLLRRNPMIWVFVARKQQQPVGVLISDKRLSTYRLAYTLHLEDLWVHPEHRRQGIGEALVQTAIRYATNNEMARVTLTTQLSNLGARRLYDKLGFAKAMPLITCDEGYDPADVTIWIQLDL